MNATISVGSSKPLFTNQSLRKLILPLVAEQFLMMMVGLVDTFMVTSAGEAAIAGVTLVDSLNLLLIQIFAALATGGAVIVSQYLGLRSSSQAQTAAKQLLYLVAIVPAILSVAALIFRRQILSAMFGAIDEVVMASALNYFTMTAMAYPFISVYNAGAALFRCMGRSSVSMWNAAITNCVNIVINAILIYGFGLGALGAGISTLISRIVAVVMIIGLLQKQDCPLRIQRLLHPEFHGDMIRRILMIGIPNGFENGLFQVGKLTVVRLVTTFGTASVAANGIAGSITSVLIVPGQAMGLALVTVIGQCMGAGDPDQAVTYTKKMLKATYIAMGISAAAVFFAAVPLMNLFPLTEEARSIAVEVLRWFTICEVLWPLSFSLPYVLRAAGDTLYTMCVSLISMFVFRIGFSFILGPDTFMGFHTAGLHLLGVWQAMFIDWGVRSIAFILRFRQGKWKTIKVI